MLTAKKSLGQHFLRSEKALKQLTESVDVSNKEDTCVFEIGPGEGVLTREILNKGYTVFCIEIDKDAIIHLEQVFQKELTEKKLHIIEKDCLEVSYSDYLSQTNFKNYFLIGNIPYYITGAIFRSTFEQSLLPTGSVFLIQKEVGERIMAKDRKESILSISVKVFGVPKIVDVVKAGSFSPPPKVDSIIVKISNIKNPFRNKEHYDKFFSILRSAFHHKRKFALSNIKNELGENVKEELTKFIGEKERAEDIVLSKWEEILRSI